MRGCAALSPAPPHREEACGLAARRLVRGRPRAGVRVRRGGRGRGRPGCAFALLTARDTVKDARFQAFGCPHTLEVAAWLCRELEGRSRAALSRARRRSGQRSTAVPVEKLGRLLVIEDALRAASCIGGNARRMMRSDGHFSDRIRRRPGQELSGRRGAAASACGSGCARPAARASPMSSITPMDPSPAMWCSRIAASRCSSTPTSLTLVDGTMVDFVKQGLNEAFRFSNPNVKGECGCGESFSSEGLLRSAAGVAKSLTKPALPRARQPCAGACARQGKLPRLSCGPPVTHLHRLSRKVITRMALERTLSIVKPDGVRAISSARSIAASRRPAWRSSPRACCTCRSARPRASTRCTASARSSRTWSAT